MSDDNWSSMEKAIAIVPKVGGALSVIACSLIMRDVSIKWYRKKSVSLTSVILFCISVVDWLYSFFAAFLSTWMIPEESGAYLASGNIQTCTAQGFIIAFTVGASMSYYALLIILYWIIVRYGWKESRMSKPSIRFSFILLPIIIACALSIPPLTLEMYNQTGLYACFIAPSPMDCEENPEVECVRGLGAWRFWDSYWVIASICNIIVIIFAGLLVYSVFRREQVTDKYLTKGMEKKRVHTMKTAWQGIRYVGAFLASHVALYVTTYYRFTKQALPNWVVLMNIILLPLLGVFNAFVYFRPRYIAFKEKNPDKSRISRFGNAVFNVNLDYLESSHSIKQRLSKTVRGLPTRMSRQSIGGDRADSDLVSPLFQDEEDVENSDEPGMV